LPGIVGAFGLRLGRKLTVRGVAASGGFPNVKLFSRYVTHAVSARILLKGVADVGGKAVTLLITAVAARTLNADAFGVMALAMATGWLLGVATDAGLSMHLARETARQAHFDSHSSNLFDQRSLRASGQGRQLLIEVLRLRAGLAYVAATMIAFFTPSIVPPHWKMQFVLIVFAQLTGAIIETVAHYFRGIERSEIESAIHAGHRFTTLVLALIVLAWWPRLDFLGAAMLIPAFVALVASIVIAFRLSVRLKADTTEDPLRSPTSAGLTPARFFKDVLPLGAAVLLSALYFRIDVFFIERWQGLEAVGGYNAVFRLVEAMRLLPAAVMAVTFPMLVQATDTRLVQRIGGALAIAGVVLAVIGALGSSVIVPLVYGRPYLYAAPTFAILSLALPLFFLNYALTHQVIGWDGQRAYLLIATLALVANVAANFALVPVEGMIGAAIATLLTEVVVTGGCLWFLGLHGEPSDRISGRTIVPKLRVERR
jgi:O-antigen/teichoic acid export membrane protein